MILDLQLNAATTDWALIRDTAEAADEAGAGAIWVFDHLSGAKLWGDRMLECFTLLGALAASTTRIALGSMVVNVANRHPGVLAVAAASVQAISGGRLLLGIGAGAAPGTTWGAEHAAIGLPLRASLSDRHAAVAETLDLFDAMWSSDRDPSLAGFPVPRPRPPVIMGVSSERLAELAGRRCDGINVRSEHDNAIDLLRAAARERAASPASMGSRWITTASAFYEDGILDPAHPKRTRFSDAGVDRMIVVCMEPPPPDLFTRHAAAWRAA